MMKAYCANCNEMPFYKNIPTAIGQRNFCSEKCYAEYVGLPVKEEGYYGLVKEYD
jgi:hypothetical protein